jgi:hypothetical protein
MPKPRKPKAPSKVVKGEYRNLEVVDGKYTFEVQLKDKTWQRLGGLSGETSKEDAENFAQSTADSWRKR